MGNLMKYTASDLPQLLDRINRNSIGMDEYFDRLFNLHETTTNYPPYNLVTVSNVESRLELALAGWSKDDIEVSTEQNVILIKSKDQEKTDTTDYVHQGVAARSFARGFNLSDDVEIGEVTFVNGMLTIELQKVIPDHQKRKVYDIV